MLKTANGLKKGKRKIIKIENYPPPEVTFLDKLVKGELKLEPILNPAGEVIGNKLSEILDNHIDAWHADPKATNLLHEYLGFTLEEYKKTLNNINSVEKIIEDKKKELEKEKIKAEKQAQKQKTAPKEKKPAKKEVKKPKSKVKEKPKKKK